MIQAAILQTLIYSDHFGFPLTLDEIYSRLISAHVGATLVVARELRDMLKKNLIQQTGDFYHLPGRKSLVARRRQSAKLSVALLARARALSRKLVSVPGVLAIYLTGSLAVGNTRGDADIDFMIITENGRLWTTRFLLTLYTEFFGLRRRPHSIRNSGKLCLNLYLTPTSYCLPVSKQNLYTAYELIQAVPLFDPLGTHSALLAANSWIHTYLPNFPFPNQPPTSTIYDLRPTIFEKLAYHLQLAYMRSKLTREYVTPDSAFFHPNNPGEQVLRKLSL